MEAKGLSAAIFFAVVVTLVPFVAKTVITAHKFDFPFFSLGSNMLLGIVAIESLRFLNLVNLAPFSLQRAANKRLLILSILSAAHSLFTGLALKGMNIPMFGALRQTTPLVNLILLVLVLKKPLPSFLIVFSVLLITLGCLLAGLGDLSFNIIPYSAGLMSVLGFAMHQTLVQKATGEGFSVADVFQVSSYNVFFMCLLATLLTGEWQAVKNYPHLTDSNFLLAFSMSLVMMLLLYVSGDLCTSLNGALTTSLVAVLKGIPTAFIGYISFGGVEYHPLNVLGLGLNMVGAILFTYGKCTETVVKRVKTS